MFFVAWKEVTVVSKFDHWFPSVALYQTILHVVVLSTSDANSLVTTFPTTLRLPTSTPTPYPTDNCQIIRRAPIEINSWPNIVQPDVPHNVTTDPLLLSTSLISAGNTDSSCLFSAISKIDMSFTSNVKFNHTLWNLLLGIFNIKKPINRAKLTARSVKMYWNNHLRWKQIQHVINLTIWGAIK